MRLALNRSELEKIRQWQETRDERYQRGRQVEQDSERMRDMNARKKEKQRRRRAIEARLRWFEKNKRRWRVYMRKWMRAYRLGNKQPSASPVALSINRNP